MAKLKSERLAVVLTLAERREQRAARQLSEHRLRVEAEQQQLVQLQRYYADYAERIDKQRDQVSVQEVITYREFSHRLADAQQQQRHRLEQLQQHLEKLYKQWLFMRQRRLTVEDLIDRTRRQEQRQRDLLEQKQLDEIAGTIKREVLDGGDYPRMH